MSHVADPIILPYVVKRILLEQVNFKAILAISVLAAEYPDALADTLISSLTQLGITSDVPIIPGTLTG